jgi:hydroxyacylglutathione hydrolase
MLYDSLFRKILPLGDAVILCPAHGSGSVCGGSISERVWTTIGLERQNNPKLRFTDRAEFIRNTAKELEKPPYFREMERLNVEGPPLLKALPVPVPLDPPAFGESMAGVLVVDTRMPDAFATAHIPGAISIWTEGLPSFAGWFLPHDKPLLLVTEEGEEEKAVRYLIRIGLDNIRGRLSGGMLAWHTSGMKSISSGTVTVQEMCGILDERRPLYLLDVRSGEELEKDGVIPNAQHIHVTQLPKRFGEIPRALPIYIFCGSGLRSTIAASLLQKEGVNDVQVVLGGFRGWTSIACPISVHRKT